MNHIRTYALLALAAATLFALSCGGGGGGSDQQPPPQQGENVDVSYSYTGAYVERSGSSTGRNASQDSGSFGTLRLIDPDEDVLIGEIDGSSTDTITFEGIEAQPTYTLEYDFTVPQDLQTGELSGTTRVVFNVPLSVEEGGDTNVETDMSIASEQGTTTMLASYQVTSATDSSSRVLRVDFQTGTVQEDMDGDGDFDDDPSWNDQNRNGLDDATDDSLPEAARGTGELESEDVVVEQLDTENYLSITADGQTWQMNGLTNVIDRRGDEDEPVTRGALATGLTVDIKGFQRGAADPLATRIRIDEGEDDDDDDGFEGRREVEVDEVTLTTVNLQTGFVIADGQRWELREVTTVRDERDASESDNAPFSRLEQGLLVDIKGWATDDNTHIARRIDIEDDQPGGGPGGGDDDDGSGDDDDGDDDGEDDDNSDQGGDDSDDDDDDGDDDDGDDD